MNEINTVADLKKLLSSKIKEDSIINCDIDVLIVYLKALQFEENTIISVKLIIKQKIILTTFKNGMIRGFLLRDNLLINKDNTICIYQQENVKEIKNILNDYRQGHFKHYIKEINNINEDYIKTMKFLTSYDSENK